LDWLSRNSILQCWTPPIAVGMTPDVDALQNDVLRMMAVSVTKN
jgi:hypothetical protein